MKKATSFVMIEKNLNRILPLSDPFIEKREPD